MYSTAISFFVLWPVGFCWSILPLVLLGARRVVTEQSWSAAMLLMISLTVMLLGGHPETVLHVVFVGVVYAFVAFCTRCLFCDLFSAINFWAYADSVPRIERPIFVAARVVIGK